MNNHKFSTKEEALATAGERLNSLLMDNIKKPVLLMLSAGSALELLEYVGESALFENLTVCMLDDRFSTEPSINNFLQLQKSDFYMQAQNKDVSFFGTLPRPNETILDVAKRFENNLKTWKQENPKGVIIATLGMGADGHTAGIFPEADEKKFANLMQSDAWVVGYNVGDKHKYSERVTTTITFFKEINFGISFVCGQEKEPKLEEVLANKTPINLLPAAAWKEIKNVEIYTNI
jgi:6-phosphogluconolactonase/glucosamine-6-phosphate isomerase/deaminase